MEILVLYGIKIIKYENKDVLLVADYIGYSIGDFHRYYLKSGSISIAYTKLDIDQETYLDKLIKLIDGAKINILTFMIMKVCCCSDLLHLAKNAAIRASRKIPIKSINVGIKGDILKEKWI